MKFTSAGTNLWAKNFYNGSADYGRGVAIDQSGNIILAGYFLGNINFNSHVEGPSGPNWLTVPGGYLAKFTTAGDHLWSKRYGSETSVARFWVMSLDSNDNIAVAGDFQFSTDLGGGSIPATSYGLDMFVAKYSSTNGAYIWATPINGISATLGRPLSIDTDSQNNIIFAGYFQGKYNFGSTQLISGLGIQDGFVTKYSSAGVPIWAKNFASTGYANANGVSIDSTNRPVVTGFFSGDANVGATSLTNQIISSNAGTLDIFIGRINQ